MDNIEETQKEVQLYFGMIVDPETGEALGTIEEDTELSADWAEEAVKKIAWAEARKAGAEVTLAVAIESSRNAFQPEVNRFVNLAKYLRATYEPHLRRFYERNITGKGKTIKTAYGSLSMRTKPEKIIVLNPDVLDRLFTAAEQDDRTKVDSVTIDFTSIPAEKSAAFLRILRDLFPNDETAIKRTFDVKGLPNDLIVKAVSEGALSVTPSEEGFTVKV